MWGRFAIPEIRPFRGEESAVRGKRARREPLSGAISRAHARDGSRRERGGDSIRRGDLIFTLFPPICFLHGKYFFRRHRGRSVFPPEPGDLLTTNYRRHGEKLYRFERIPRGRTRGSGDACGVVCGSRGEGRTPGRAAARDREAPAGRSVGRRDPGSCG
jgi:hypothetical protein